MYGAPTIGYGAGAEVVQSLNALIEAIKRRQISRPRSRFQMRIADCKIPVQLLPNGFLEVNGEVPPIAVEKKIEATLQCGGVFLDEVVVLR